MSGYQSKRESAMAKLQEPVAWIWKDMRGQDIVSLFEPRLNSIPLYTTPQQRKPLSDDSIFDFADIYLYNNGGKSYGILKFARAIEAAHGIKGNT